MSRRGQTLLGAVVACCLAVAAGPVVTAWALSPTSNPFSVPGSQPATPTTSAAPTTSVATSTGTGTASTGGSGLSGTDAIIIAAGAAVLLGGISFFIWTDARKRAPVRHRAAVAGAGAGEGTRGGSKPKPKPRKPSPAERRRRKRGRAR